jgi:hypothetical protein
MAAPTPLEQINWDGTRGSIRWIAEWTDGTQLTDTQLVDLDGDLAPAPTSIKIRSVDIIINGNVKVTLEFDATTDQLIDRFEGQSDVSHPFIRDYTDGPNGGFIPSNTGATGFTGDPLITTTGAANGDEVNLFMTFEKSE